MKRVLIKVGVGLVAPLAAAVFLLPAACSSPDKKQAGPPGGPVPVVVGTAERRNVPNTLPAIGTVEASNTVRVRARVGGELTRVVFEEGKNVRQGDLLMTLDPRPFQIALASALADSARDHARATSAASLAQRDADLIQKDYITKQQYDEDVAAAGAAEATLAGDAAACRNARLNLSYCSIRAPISGRTGNLLVRQGNLVGANDPNPLVVIQQTIPTYVSFSAPEKFLPEIRRQAAGGPLTVEARFSEDTTRVFTGRLTVIDNAVDETTGTILLKATFPNTDEALWPGQFVNVSLILSVQRDAVVVPASAVQQGQQGDFVYLIKPDQTAAMQPVKVGTKMDNEVVIDQGVQADDRVVVDGQLRLTPGAKLDIRTSGAPTGDGKR